jgi:diadenosine tetraphosphate (Ap4A) HIT family hydrolase
MDIIFSTKNWDVRLSDDQTYFGRLVLVSRTERASLPDLSPEEQKDFFELIRKLEDFYREKFSATMFNYSCLMNNAYRDGEKPRVHWHFRPRYADPIIVAGVTIADPNFGNHYIPTAFGIHDQVSDAARGLLVDSLEKHFASS